MDLHRKMSAPSCLEARFRIGDGAVRRGEPLAVEQNKGLPASLRQLNDS